MTERLRIWTLGGLRIELDGEPLSGLASRKAEALLVYLACTGNPQPREVLATMLWDDRPQERALSNLSVLLSSLRKHLADYVTITRHTVSINPDSRKWMDVIELERHLQNATEQPRRTQTLSGETIAAYKAIVELYQGDFLAGFHLRDARGFEEWLLLQKERLQRGALAGFSALVRYHLHAGQYAQGIERAQRWLEIEPLEEEAHRLLMRLFAYSGRRNAALLQYEQCKQNLENELGVEPSNPTRRLHERVRLSMRAARDNLPAETTSFVGRRNELAAIRQKLADPQCRLLTVVGVGGIGKTRLALRAVRGLKHAYLNGIWLVELADLDDPALVVQAATTALGLTEQPAGNAGEMGGSVPSTPDRLVDYLKPREMILILDNCEHLIDSCAQLTAKILRDCPHVKILATSRQRLGLDGETVWHVPPLGLPKVDALIRKPGAMVEDSDAVTLFRERGASIRPDLHTDPSDTVAAVQICRRLEGMPLAIELAAARLSVLTPDEISTRLDDRFQLLASGSRSALPRQQTLRATVEWSYDLLDESERLFFERLSVFRGSISLVSAEAVCSGAGITEVMILDLMDRLVDKSLVLRLPTPGRSRYRVLETLREFGAEKLRTRGESSVVRRRHADYFVALAQEADPGLISDAYLEWLARLEEEKDNLRAALQWSLDKNDSEASLQIVCSLWESYWLNQGYFSEGLARIKSALATRPTERSKLRAEAILAQAALTWALGDHPAADSLLLECIDLAEEIEAPDIWAWARYYQGVIARNHGKLPLAYRCHRDSLSTFRKLEDKRGTAWQFYQLAAIELLRNHLDRAEILGKESLKRKREIADHWGIGWSIAILGETAMARADYPASNAYLEEAREYSQKLANNRVLQDVLTSLGETARLAGDIHRSMVYHEEALDLARQLAYKHGEAYNLYSLGKLARLQGEFDQAVDMLLESLSLYEEITLGSSASLVLEELAAVRLEKKDVRRATMLFALATTQRTGSSVSRIPKDELAYQEQLEACKTELGDEQFDRIWAAGECLSLQDAISLAVRQDTNHW